MPGQQLPQYSPICMLAMVFELADKLGDLALVAPAGQRFTKPRRLAQALAAMAGRGGQGQGAGLAVRSQCWQVLLAGPANIQRALAVGPAQQAGTG